MAGTKQKATKPCKHLECSAGKYDGWRTWPNVVTALRTVGAVVLVTLALAQHSNWLLFAGLACYWLGDMADGWLARLTNTETRTGGLFDILADRLCVAMFYVSYAGWHHNMLLPIAIFLLNFMLVDNQLSMAYLKWPILSPNYFYLIDKTIYKLNWSKPAKALNTSLFLIVVVVTGLPWLAALVAATQLVVKIYSSALLTRLPVPTSIGSCAQRT